MREPSPTGLRTLLEWELHPSRTLYAFEDLTARRPRGRFEPGGPGGVPRGREWFIEDQHYGHFVAMAGLRLGDDELVRRGVGVMDYGVGRMTPEATYDHEDWHHSAAFFYEALARMLLLREPLKLPAATIETWSAALRHGVTWFADRRAWNDHWWRDSMHHRFFLNPAAIFMADAALPTLEGAAVEQAYAWISEGLRRQRHDGAHTELGGHDTGYHSLSMTFTAGIVLTARIHDALRDDLRASLRRAADWLLTRIGDDGRIDDTGNTRMGPGSMENQRTRGPRRRRIKFHETAFALVGAAHVLADDALSAAAQRILAAYGAEDAKAAG